MNICLVIFLISVIPIVHAANVKSISYQLNNKIEELVSSYAPEAYVGYVIRSIKTGEVLLEKNMNRLFIPASNMKVFTAAASLVELGINYQFETAIYTSAVNTINHEAHDLYIKFTGDPTLTLNDLNQMISQIAKKGVHVIRGHVYIDNGTFDKEPYGPGWMIEDSTYCFSAPINAIVLNKNCFSVRFIKNKHEIQVSESQIPVGLEIISELKLASKNTSCLVKARSYLQNQYRFSGCLTEESTPYQINLAVTDIELFAKEVVGNILKRNQITFQEPIVFVNKLPADLSLIKLSEHYSRPLLSLVKVMLEDSDNVIAETLVKILGHRFTNTSGSWLNGTAAIKKILTRHFKINFQGSKIVDGSGTSRYNLITPSLISDLLHGIYKNLQLKEHYIDAMPTSGKDGKWFKHRFHDIPELNNQVTAKSGTMDGVTSLSGYMLQTEIGPISFVVFVNNFSKSVKYYKQFENKFCKILFNCLNGKC